MQIVLFEICLLDLGRKTQMQSLFFMKKKISAAIYRQWCEKVT